MVEKALILEKYESLWQCLFRRWWKNLILAGTKLIQSLFVRHKLIVVEGNYLLLNDGDWKALGSLFNERWYDVDCQSIS